MKKQSFLIAFLFCTISLFAQAPQGLNYQAVAYNGSGAPVPNQLLGVRLSILDGSATGTLVYQETQGPTTDNTGLFSIVIGNGTVVSGTFNTINWGNGSKWLKTEIDINGGASYVVMGTTQFMSVPYALYANTGGLRSPSFSNPDGFENATTVVIPDSTNFTVPAGKNLYITAVTTVYGMPVIDGDTLKTFITPNANDIAGFLGISENSTVWNGYGSIVGFLVDKKVEWKTINLTTNTFTVPANKQFVVLKTFGYPQTLPCMLTFNGTALGRNTMISNAIIDEGSLISSSGCVGSPTPYIINGYLIDKH